MRTISERYSRNETAFPTKAVIDCHITAFNRRVFLSRLIATIMAGPKYGKERLKEQVRNKVVIKRYKEILSY